VPRSLPSSARDVARGLLAIALFTAWPLLNFANRNRERLDSFAGDFLMSVAAVAFGVAAASFLLGFALSGFRRVPALALAVVAAVTLFFNHQNLVEGLEKVVGGAAGPVWLALSLAICGAALALGNRRAVPGLLLTFGLVASLIPGSSLAIFALRGEPDLAASLEPPGLELRSTPNIFHIIVDSYAREDALRRFLGYDNAAFVAALRQRGFYVADASYSNYPATFLSLASTLGMDYFVTEETPRFKTVGSQFYPLVQGENPAAAELRRHGYAHIQQSCVVSDISSCGPAVDLCLGTGRTALDQSLLDRTALSFVTERARPSTLGDFTSRLDEVFSQRPPLYAFVHSTPPHPPMTYAPDCRPASEPAPLADHWRNRASYMHDIECVNGELLGLVDEILSRDPEAVILVHGDHGSAFGVDWSQPMEGWSEEQVEERYSILMAVRLPATCRDLLYPTLSPVNLYRVVLACLAEVEPTLRPDELYISPKPSHPDWGSAYRVGRPRLSDRP
jgi:hypothetical protein